MRIPPAGAILFLPQIACRGERRAPAYLFLSFLLIVLPTLPVHFSFAHLLFGGELACDHGNRPRKALDQTDIWGWYWMEGSERFLCKENKKHTQRAQR